jgi:hypothetical protein
LEQHEPIHIWLTESAPGELAPAMLNRRADPVFVFFKRRGELIYDPCPEVGPFLELRAPPSVIKCKSFEIDKNLASMRQTELVRIDGI